VMLMDYTMDSCPPILGYTAEMPPVYAAHCAKRNERVFSLIEQHKMIYAAVQEHLDSGAIHALSITTVPIAPGAST
ncbi:MAG: BolA/IbaG family iron-sulfur metabolism protein, partial [Thermoleophilia bacterium]|nr:BolA/IbaG family iron-sulfur metabolism protein [Thermoleophilia bacterium]